MFKLGDKVLLNYEKFNCNCSSCKEFAKNPKTIVGIMGNLAFLEDDEGYSMDLLILYASKKSKSRKLPAWW